MNAVNVQSPYNPSVDSAFYRVLYLLWNLHSKFKGLVDNNFSAYMLAEQPLRAGADMVAVTIRLPWYRSLPISTVRIADLKVDGKNVPLHQIEFEVNGRRRTLDACMELIDEQWYVLDDGTLHVKVPGLAHASDHLIDFTLNLHPPYMPGFTWVTHSSKRLKAER